METIKVFISQPMRGKEDSEILEERAKATANIKRMFDGIESVIIDSFFPENAEKMTPLECLGNSIKLLSQADVVYFADGWENARGCMIERLCTAMYGIPVIEPDESKVRSHG